MAHRRLSEHSRSVERLRRRADRFLAQQQLYSGARDACRRCYRATKIRPANVKIRESFIISRGISSATDSFSQRMLSLSGNAIQQNPETVNSPAGSLITPRGIALQVYLIAMFEAQCKVGAGIAPRNDRPIVSPDRQTLGWIDLIASETVTAKLPTTKRDNLLRQFKRALVHLERERLVMLSRSPGSNGRFESFRLLDESGSLSNGGSEVPYLVPKELDSDDYQRDVMPPELRLISPNPIIAVPVDFFLHGWVHVLSPAEIVTYFMLRDLAEVYRVDEGAFVCAKPREQHYGLRRDVYEAHRLLSLYGLVLQPDFVTCGERTLDAERPPLDDHGL